jgi:tetratricopeptide (TPR) repeat protein
VKPWHIESKPALVLDALQDLLMVSILLAAPLVFFTHGHDVFEFNKITIVRILCSLAVVLKAAQLAWVRPGRWVRSPLDWPLLAFMAAAMISWLHTVSPYLSTHGVYEDFEGITTVLMYGFLALWMQQHVRTQRQVNLFFGAVILAGTLAGFYGILQNFQIDFVPWNPATYSKNRLFATMGNPNFLAAYLVMSLPLTFLAFLDLPERIQVEKKFNTALVVLGAIVSVLLVRLFSISYFDFKPSSYEASSFASMLLTPKFIAAHLVVLFPLAAAGFLYFGRLKLVLLISMLFQIISIYFTKSSGGILALILSVILLAGFFIWEARRSSTSLKSNKFWLIALLACLVLAQLYPPIRQTTVETVQRLVHRLSAENLTMTPRLYIWRSAVEMLRDHWAFGTGLDTFQISFPPYRTALYWALEWNGTPEKAHNMILQIAATQGLAGLATFFWLLAAYVWALWRLLKREMDARHRMLAFGGLVAVLAFITQNLFSFTVVGYGSLFWMLLGLVPAMGVAWAPRASIEEVDEKATVPAWTFIAVPALGLAMFLFAVHSTRIWVADSFYKQGQIGMSVGRWDYALAVYQKACGSLKPMPANAITAILQPVTGTVKPEIQGGLNPAQELYWVKQGIAYEAAAAAQTENARKEQVYMMALAVHHLTVETNPINGYNYNNKGRTLKAAGEALNRPDYLQAAALHYERAIRLDPNNVYFNLDLANTYMDLAQWDKAFAICDRLRGLYPDFSMPEAYMGYIRLRQGQTEESLRWFEAALPKDWKGENQQLAVSSASAAAIWMQKSQMDKAASRFQRAVEANPGYADAWLNLARANEKLGRKAEAMKAWQGLLAAQKDSPEAQKAMQRLGGGR